MNNMFLTAVVSFASAGFGAFAAFQLQDARDKRREFDGHRKAVNRALFDLSQIWNTQHQYWKEAILPDKNTPAPWLRIQANVSAQFHEASFKIDELFFLSDTDHAQFLGRLYIEELRFRIVKDMIQERSNIVLNQLYPQMEALGIREGTEFNVARVEEALGPDLRNKLKSLTAAIIDHVEENIRSTEELNAEFRQKMAEYFQKKRFFGLFSKKQLNVLEIKYEK